MCFAEKSRWIRMDISVFDHPLFEGKEFSEREAWLWLISKAVWKETTHRIGGMTVPVPVGSLYATLRQLAKAWGWKSDKRVRNFLKVLESQHMIIIETDAGKTHITICNYERYQEPKHKVDAGETQQGRTKDTKTPNHIESKKDRVRGDDSDLEGFVDWFANHPTSAYDNRGAAEKEWLKLTADERRKVIDETPSFYQDARANGRTFPLSPHKYLAGRHWERKRPKPSMTPGKKKLHEAASGLTASAVVMAAKTREDVIREHIKRNAQPWEGQGVDRGAQSSKFLQTYTHKRADKHAGNFKSAGARSVEGAREHDEQTHAV